MESYFLSDEDLYLALGCAKENVATAVAEGTRTACRYRTDGGKLSAEKLALSLGVRIETDSWMVADDRIMMLGECSLKPPVLRVNERVVQKLIDKGRQLGISTKCLDLGQVRETVIAHELFHIISRKGSGELTELAAHSFARVLLGLEFSPLLFNRILSLFP